MKNESPRQLTFRLDALVMVCKACGKRSSGPQEAKPKKVAQAIKETGKAQKRKVRVVMTSCVGLCPKRATAVVVADRHGLPAQFAVERLDQASEVLALRQQSQGDRRFEADLLPNTAP